MPSDPRAVLDEVVRRIAEVAQPDEIILFASAARGETDLPTLLKEGGVEVPEGIRQAGNLTQYAVQARYRALAMAEDVVRWVEGSL